MKPALGVAEKDLRRSESDAMAKERRYDVMIKKHLSIAIVII